MKTLLFIFLCLIPVMFFTQDLTKTETTNEYLEKSIRQKKTANVLSITGGSMLVGGLVIASTDSQKGLVPSTATLTGITIATLGVATALASVPFYISSYRNKQKSVSISPQMGNAVFNQKSYIITGISISF